MQGSDFSRTINRNIWKVLAHREQFALELKGGLNRTQALLYKTLAPIRSSRHVVASSTNTLAISAKKQMDKLELKRDLQLDYRLS